MKLPYIEAGEIVTTHGVRGEVKVLSWLDCPEMLCEFDRCRIEGKEYAMDAVRVHWPERPRPIAASASATAVWT